MKRLCISLLALVLIGFVSASVVVHNYTVEEEYFLFETIVGKINLTVSGEDYLEKIFSNDGDEMLLGDYLKRSGVIFECSPPDCSSDYAFSDGEVSKSFSVPSAGNIYVGFVLNGEEVVLESLDFKIDSDFEESYRPPLRIGFFGEEEWVFSNFSDSLLQKNWGCYNSLLGSPGALVGKNPYCELINVQDSGALNVGAQVSGSDTVNLTMSVYSDGGIGSWECGFNPNSDSGCLVEAYTGEVFSGAYQVCVGADDLTGYRIYDEVGEDSCGFVYGEGYAESDKDYAIFAQGAKYKDASSLGSFQFEEDGFISAANQIIVNKYFGDCSDGCVLPLEISGVSQNVNIYDVELVFTEDLEYNSDDKVYDLSATPATVDYSGILDLGILNFDVSKSMEYIFSLGDYELFKKNFKILPAPIISSLSPLSPPAGVAVNFYASVDFTDNVSLVYDWDFGDGKSEKTDSPLVVHSYSDLTNYTLSLTVTAGGNLSSVKTFEIVTISPEAAIETTLVSKKKSLSDVRAQVDALPSWYGDELAKLIRLDFFDSELTRLDKAKNKSFDNESLIDIAGELYALDIPIVLNTETSESPHLLTTLNDINLEPVSFIGGSVGGSDDGYDNAILNWQELNIVATYISKQFSILLSSGKFEDVFRTYSFNINSDYYDESYFVIDKSLSDLYFKEIVGARKATEDFTVIVLPDEGAKSFDFYYKGEDSFAFFVSPKLSSIIVKENIDISCNHNGICEKENGEDPDGCRSDCKPITRLIVYWILLLLLALVVYGFFQVWYKNRYEAYLFKDRSQMYNLLMYVTNARARGRRDDRIAAELRSKGWSSERVNYVIRKSRGQRTGMYEIVPIEKVLAFFRNRKAKKTQEAKLGIATDNKQQFGRNINKSRFRRKF